MNICQHHWDKLRAAVEERGMSHLVAQSGEQAADDFVAQLEGRSTIKNWDPLMAAWSNLGRVGLKRCGLAAFNPDFCFLCEVQKSFDQVKTTAEFNPERHRDADWWIASCMDAMLSYARGQGLMPGVQ